MALSTKPTKVTRYILILYFLVFPIGQLLRIQSNINGVHVAILGIDIVIGMLFVSFLYSFGISKTTHLMKSVIWVSVIFSSLVFVSQFQSISEVVGLFYLIRMIGYIGLFTVVKNEISSGFLIDVLKKWLIFSVVVSALLGLLQYSFYPDLIALVPYGWDAHLFRLVGTFLDPGFIGIILVLGFILIFTQFTETAKKQYYFLAVFLVLPLLLTYSRATYLAFVASLCILFLYSTRQAKGILIGIALIFLASIPFLPQPRGVGVDLTRTHSVITRVSNYEVTYRLWKTSPVFGVGYNNICVAKKFYGFEETAQNSCSGSDSSILFTLTTVGIVGIILILYEFFKYNSLFILLHDRLLITSVAAVGVHSLFLNSAYYPWVISWMVLLFAIHKSVFGVVRKEKS